MASFSRAVDYRNLRSVLTEEPFPGMDDGLESFLASVEDSGDLVGESYPSFGVDPGSILPNDPYSLTQMDVASQLMISAPSSPVLSLGDFPISGEIDDEMLALLEELEAPNAFMHVEEAPSVIPSPPKARPVGPKPRPGSTIRVNKKATPRKTGRQVVLLPTSTEVKGEGGKVAQLEIVSRKLRELADRETDEQQAGGSGDMAGSSTNKTPRGERTTQPPTDFSDLPLKELLAGSAVPAPASPLHLPVEFEACQTTPCSPIPSNPSSPGGGGGMKGLAALSPLVLGDMKRPSRPDSPEVRVSSPAVSLLKKQKALGAQNQFKLRNTGSIRPGESLLKRPGDNTPRGVPAKLVVTSQGLISTPLVSRHSSRALSVVRTAKERNPRIGLSSESVVVTSSGGSVKAVSGSGSSQQPKIVSITNQQPKNISSSNVVGFSAPPGIVRKTAQQGGAQNNAVKIVSSSSTIRQQGGVSVVLSPQIVRSNAEGGGSPKVVSVASPLISKQVVVRQEPQSKRLRIVPFMAQPAKSMLKPAASYSGVAATPDGSAGGVRLLGKSLLPSVGASQTDGVGDTALESAGLHNEDDETSVSARTSGLVYVKTRKTAATIDHSSRVVTIHHSSEKTSPPRKLQAVGMEGEVAKVKKKVGRKRKIESTAEESAQLPVATSEADQPDSEREWIPVTCVQEAEDVACDLSVGSSQQPIDSQGTEDDWDMPVIMSQEKKQPVQIKPPTKLARVVVEQEQMHSVATVVSDPVKTASWGKPVTSSSGIRIIRSQSATEEKAPCVQVVKSELGAVTKPSGVTIVPSSSVTSVTSACAKTPFKIVKPSVGQVVMSESVKDIMSTSLPLVPSSTSVPSERVKDRVDMKKPSSTQVVKSQSVTAVKSSGLTIVPAKAEGSQATFTKAPVSSAASAALVSGKIVTQAPPKPHSASVSGRSSITVSSKPDRASVLPARANVEGTQLQISETSDGSASKGPGGQVVNTSALDPKISYHLKSLTCLLSTVLEQSGNSRTSSGTSSPQAAVLESKLPLGKSSSLSDIQDLSSKKKRSGDRLAYVSSTHSSPAADSHSAKKHAPPTMPDALKPRSTPVLPILEKKRSAPNLIEAPKPTSVNTAPEGSVREHPLPSMPAALKPRSASEPEVIKAEPSAQVEDSSQQVPSLTPITLPSVGETTNQTSTPVSRTLSRDEQYEVLKTQPVSFTLGDDQVVSQSVSVASSVCDEAEMQPDGDFLRRSISNGNADMDTFEKFGEKALDLSLPKSESLQSVGNGNADYEPAMRYSSGNDSEDSNTNSSGSNERRKISLIEYMKRKKRYEDKQKHKKQKKQHHQKQKQQQQQQQAAAEELYSRLPTYMMGAAPSAPAPPAAVAESEESHMEMPLPEPHVPIKERSDVDGYSKLPSYTRCFTNSTKYDESQVMDVAMYDEDQVADAPVSELPEPEPEQEVFTEAPEPSENQQDPEEQAPHVAQENEEEKSTKYPWDALRNSTSAQSSRANSPCVSARSQRSIRSYSPETAGSSRVESASEDESPSRTWRTEGSTRPKYKSTSRRSRSRSRSRSRRSRSRSRSSRRYRSRSRSDHRRYERRQHRRSERSRDRMMRERKSRAVSPERQGRVKDREEEKMKQIEERRNVFVGNLPRGYGSRALHRRFGRFGDIQDISIHHRLEQDSFAFVIFKTTESAYAAVEDGNRIPGEPRVDLSFGGRREFCKVQYSDLDAKTHKEEEDEWKPRPVKKNVINFDDMLADFKALKKKNSSDDTN